MSKKTKEDLKNANEEISTLEMESLPVANIIVAGGTGVGKSTLLNAIFGKELAETGTGKPITNSMDTYEQPGIPIKIWDTVGLEMDAERTKKSIQDIKNTIAENVSSSDPMQRIHAIWYCINSGSNRYQGAELDFIYDLHSIGVPFIIVLTQCERDPSELVNEINKINQEKGMNDISIVKVLAQDVKMINNITIPAFGLKDIVDETLKQMPDFIQTSFIAAQHIDKQKKREAAEKLVFQYAEAAKNGLFDNIGLINLLTASDKVSKIYKQVAQIYSLQFFKDEIEKLTNRIVKIDWCDTVFGLILPVDYFFEKKITQYFENQNGKMISNPSEKIDRHYRAARVILLYGYVFINTMEQFLDKYTYEQLEKANNDYKMLSNELADIFDNNMKMCKGGSTNE